MFKVRGIEVKWIVGDLFSCARSSVSAVCSRSLRADGLKRVRGAGHEQHGVREPAEAGPREQGREVELDAARDPDHLAGVTK